ncbi:MAG: guanylate kinase [Coxiella sp. RIFCSPHIGHO2_12_FULL_42_15]|nr:MAG: guanylate kinase [Coxiella sp. RIFCSPHIGHO2_12_FULL_42_15]
MNRSGKIFIIAAPSGAGKTSLVNATVLELDRIQISVSYTTRPPRPGDKNKVHYHFITEAEFEKMVESHAFLEYATVYGYRYGTGQQWVSDRLQQGIDVILEIDWQGAHQLRGQFRRAVSIFILPPSVAELAKRLEGRQQDDSMVIQARMAKARSEMAHYDDFDYLIVNDHFDTAKAELCHIILAERLRLMEQKQEKAQLLAELLKND